MKKNLKNGLVAMAAVGLLAGGAISANAATNTTTYKAIFNGKAHTTIARTKLTAAQQAKMAARQQARTAKRAAIQAAITSNNYQAWVTAVGTNSPLVSKITATNFAQYVQAYNLQQQASQILTSLGIVKRGMSWQGWMMGTAATTAPVTQ